MKVPATLDLDRVLEAALVAVHRAMQSWSEGGLQTEEPLLNHLIGELSRDRGALNRSTRYERLSRPKGPRGVSA